MRYLAAMLLVPALLLGWVAVQEMARRFARAHPELGPFREEGGGCGGHCSCLGGSCPKAKESTRPGDGTRSTATNR